MVMVHIEYLQLIILCFFSNFCVDEGVKVQLAEVNFLHCASFYLQVMTRS